jgi:hypothetical protein
MNRKPPRGTIARYRDRIVEMMAKRADSAS